MRYRLEYVHLATSGRLRFTVETEGLEGAARGRGSDWLHESGLHPTDFAFLSVVSLEPPAPAQLIAAPECSCARSGCPTCDPRAGEAAYDISR